MVICLEQGADLHMAQLMPLPLTVSCFGKIQIGFTLMGSPGKRAVKRVCCMMQVSECPTVIKSCSNVLLQFISFLMTDLTALKFM